MITEYHPDFSVHLADFETEGYPPAVCLTWYDCELIEPIIECRFDDMEILQRIHSAIGQYIEIGSYMKKYGYKEAVSYFGLDNVQVEIEEEDLDTVIDRILEEGL